MLLQTYKKSSEEALPHTQIEQKAIVLKNLGNHPGSSTFDETLDKNTQIYLSIKPPTNF